MLPPPARSTKRGKGLGEVLDSRGVSPAHWLSEPAGSLAVHPGASFLVHMVRQTISKCVRHARHCSGSGNPAMTRQKSLPSLELPS